MKKAEIILATLSILALVLNLLLIPGGVILTILSLSTLSMFYFYFGFAMFNAILIKNILKKESFKGISNLRVIGACGAGLALAMTTVGILFKFQSWPFADVNLQSGLVCLLIVMIIALVKYFKSYSGYYSRILKRATIIGGLGLILVVIPKKTIIEFQYRNYPGYVDAMKKALENPDNETLWYMVDVERSKMDTERKAK